MATRVFLVTGLVVPPSRRVGELGGSLSPGLGRRFYKEHRLTLPRNYRLLSFGSAHSSLGVCYYGTDHGVFCIKAHSRRAAYALSDSLWGFMSLAYGFEADTSAGEYVLQELEDEPQPTWSDSRLLSALRQCNSDASDHTVHALCSGPAIEFYRLEQLQAHLPALQQVPALREALAHFRTSRQLFYGYMTGSYYQMHYSRDRAQLTRSWFDKQFYEFRTRFELAFVAAFKAIERLLNTTHFRANEAHALIATATHLGLTPTSVYRRKHEVFRRLPAKASVEEMVRHFLKLRNAVAAHANSAPPRHLMLSEDSVYEIQHFVGHLVWSAVEAHGRAVGVRRWRIPACERAT